MKTGINFEQCKVCTAEMHNTRNPEYIAAVNASPNKTYSIFEDQTKMNSSWVNLKYCDKTLPGLLDELRTLYKDKVGQTPQEKDRVRSYTDKKTGMRKTSTTAGWSPIREGVCPIKPDTKISDFKPFIKWLNSKGLEVIRIDIHHDEGYEDILTGNRIYNHHAHLIVDWIDHKTGRSQKLSKIDTSEMQTQLAASLNMERGECKALTGVDHLTPNQQRAKAAAHELQLIQSKIIAENQKLKLIQDEIDAKKQEFENKRVETQEEAQRLAQIKIELQQTQNRLIARKNDLESTSSPIAMFKFLTQISNKMKDSLEKAFDKDGWEVEVIDVVMEQEGQDIYTEISTLYENDSFNYRVNLSTGQTTLEAQPIEEPENVVKVLSEEFTPNAYKLFSSVFFNSIERETKDEGQNKGLSL